MTAEPVELFTYSNFHSFKK